MNVEGAHLTNPVVPDVPVPSLASLYHKAPAELDSAVRKAKARSQRVIRRERREALLRESLPGLKSDIYR